jgi:hypothetical protein
VLQVLTSSLLGAVFGLVCHNAHKQQPLYMTRVKCSFKVKTKSPGFTGLFGSILSRFLSL